MKKMLLSLLMLLALSAGAQPPVKAAKDSLPYEKFPTLPAMSLLSPDSSRTFNFYNIPEGRPTVLFFFSPDCEHCQLSTKAMLARMDEMKGADFYFMTPMPLTMLRPFMAEYHLPSYKNIVAGKDYQYFFPSFYGAKTVPYLVVYDRKKRLVRLWDGGTKPDTLIKVLRAL